MKRPILFRVELEPAAFEPLLAAIAASGQRAGWLELDWREPPPASFVAAAGPSVLRVVAVGERSTLAYKPRRGPAVLSDLLQEHFRGVAAVFVRGEVGAPGLAPAAEGWLLSQPGEAGQAWTTDHLVAALRRPSAWRTPVATP